MIVSPAILSGKPEFAEFLPITRPWTPRFDQLAPDLERCLETGILTKGPYLEQFEAHAADLLQTRYVTAVSSCTTGLSLAYLCLGLTGEVIVPSFTFMATVGSIVLAGLTPVFADALYGDANIDPERIEAAITEKTSAIVAVHNHGAPCDIRRIQEIADRHELRLIFDAAHGLGSVYQGEPVGGQGDAQIFSLSPTKTATAGEGGLVACNDPDLAERIRIGREYGHFSGYDCLFPGPNGRMPEFSAILGIHSLTMLHEAVERRNCLAEVFRRELSNTPGIGFQVIRKGDRSSYKDVSVKVTSEFGMTRDDLATALRAENIDSRAYYNPPCHKQTAFAKYTRDTSTLQVTERLAMECLSLPAWSHMNESVVVGICRAIRKIHEHAAAVRNYLAPLKEKGQGWGRFS